MTVIVALMCQDGIVLASDSEGTDLEAKTKIEVVSKIFPLGTHIAWGASGPIGLQQVTHESLQPVARPNWAEKALAQLRGSIQDKFVGRQKEALNNYVPLPGSGPPAMEALVCGFTSEKWILEITATAQQEQHFKFCAVGSGKKHAFDLWGHLRHFEPHQSTVEIGKLMAYRIINDVITNEYALVGPPVRMWAITHDGAAELPEAEINGLGTLMTGWQTEERQSLRRLLEGLGDTSGDPPPAASSE